MGVEWKVRCGELLRRQVVASQHEDTGVGKLLLCIELELDIKPHIQHRIRIWKTGDPVIFIRSRDTRSTPIVVERRLMFILSLGY